MKLFDNLLKKEKKIKGKVIKMYCCGPTVYNHIHLGNARTLIYADILYRTLKEKYKKVIYTRNITDVDDKIIEKAKENNEDPKKLSNRMYQNFLKISKILNIEEPNHTTKVTDFIDKIIIFIKKLIKKKKAYISTDGVFFDTNSIKYDFFETKEERISRIKNLDKKIDKDFALWKFDENFSFSSPWGKGRPGWHIECSTMLFETLGKNIQIHCGGIDLAFPHHHNEIAQSLGCFNVIPADIWLHFNFLNINKEKMSKSLNNFIYAIDFVNQARRNKDKFFFADVLRYMFLSSHYSKELKFSDELLEKSKQSLNKLREFYFTHPPTRKIKPNLTFLYNDLNTSETIDLLHKYTKEKKNKNLFHSLIHTLGFHMKDRTYLKLDLIDKYIEKRNFYKKIKNYKKADEIRKFLLKNYISIKDDKNNTKWNFF